MSSENRLHSTLKAFDQANSLDPNREQAEGVEYPKELLYAQRMSQMLHTFMAEPSEHLQLAARAQHIERWHIPRSDYPMDRPGYKRWRTTLGQYHAQRAAQIMADKGYDPHSCSRVSDLLQKKQLKRDPEAQALEDVICLVFLAFYLEDFAAGHGEAKLIDIIRKTWNKMSEQSHAAALALPLSAAMSQLVGRALA